VITYHYTANYFPLFLKLNGNQGAFNWGGPVFLSGQFASFCTHASENN